MLPTLRSLSADPRFGIVPHVEGAGRRAMDRLVTWVHSSDLLDPTPWLEPGQLLLTNGAHLPVGAPDGAWTAYVERLAGSEVGGLGFATDVVHAEVPAAVVRACRASGLPLVEVTGRTPFIAIVREVADALAAEQRERLEWSLSAQRAVARAALRPDGLESVLHELERRLDCWVALFDAAGTQVPTRTTMPMPREVSADVTASVRSVLQRGSRAGARLRAAAGDVTMQTLGQRDSLRGVLVVGTATPLDPAGTDLVASVIALASISVEQGRALDAARTDLRAGLLELMLAGSLPIARATAERLGDRLPAEPLVVATFALVPQSAPVLHELERACSGNTLDGFVATRGPRCVVVLPAAGVPSLEEVVDTHGVRVGVSARGGWAELDRLLGEAEQALHRGSGSRMVSRFEAMYGEGMLGLLDERGATEVARRLLRPLADHPDREGLVETMRVWLAHGCAWDPAARELGIHRHTLRNRTHVVERLLGLDLATFAGRAELWMVLQFTDTDG